MAFFALIHGGAHGGWCWEDLVPDLEHLGHGWSAPDLPFGETDGVAEWADAVVASIPTDARDVIVVGHSLGGLAVPVVATRRPVRHMVFLAAMVPVPGTSYLEVLAAEPDAITVASATDRIRGEADDRELEGDVVMPWAHARDAFYQDLPEGTARSAWRRLRNQGPAVFSEPCPLTEWPDIPSTYILMTEDNAVSPDWSRRVARGRLGADVVELPGGHSPFYGHPRELAAALDQIASRQVRDA